MDNPGLEFRLASPADARELFPIWSDEDVTKYTLIRDISTEDDCESRIQRQTERIRKEGGLGPFCARYGGQTIGYFGATSTAGKKGEYEIFYNLSKDHWGKGFGTAMATYLLSLVFDGTGEKTVIAYAVVENAASWRILEKMGLVRTGWIEKEPVHSGRKYDLYKYEKTGVTLFTPGSRSTASTPRTTGGRSGAPGTRARS